MINCFSRSGIWSIIFFTALIPSSLLADNISISQSKISYKIVYSTPLYQYDIKKLFYRNRNEQPLLISFPLVTKHRLVTRGNQNYNIKNITNSIISDMFNAGRIFCSDTKEIYTSPARATRKDLLLWGGILTAGLSIYTNDQQILDALQRRTENKWYKPFADLGKKFDKYGNTQDWLYYYYGGLGAGYILKIKPLQTVSGQILESWFIGGGIKNIVTVLFGRARPHEGKGPKYFKFGDGVSFFSGHTSNMFQLATILSHHVDFLPFTIASYSIASSVGLHRIHDNQHWPSDVFIGAAYGTLISRAVIKLHEKRNLHIIPMIEPDNYLIGINTIYQF